MGQSMSSQSLPRKLLSLRNSRGLSPPWTLNPRHRPKSHGIPTAASLPRQQKQKVSLSSRTVNDTRYPISCHGRLGKRNCLQEWTYRPHHRSRLVFQWSIPRNLRHRRKSPHLANKRSNHRHNVHPFLSRSLTTDTPPSTSLPWHGIPLAIPSPSPLLKASYTAGKIASRQPTPHPLVPSNAPP